MDHVRIAGKTRTLGLDQGYQPLHVKDEIVDGFMQISMAWTPDEADLVLLNHGGAVRFTLLGPVGPSGIITPPPMRCDTIGSNQHGKGEGTGRDHRIDKHDQ